MGACLCPLCHASVTRSSATGEISSDQAVVIMNRVVLMSELTSSVRRRDSPISSSLFSYGPPPWAVTCVLNINQVPGPGVCHTDCIRYEMHRQQCQCTVTMFNRLFLSYFQTDMFEIAYNYKLAAIILST